MEQNNKFSNLLAQAAAAIDDGQFEEAASLLEQAVPLADELQQRVQQAQPYPPMVTNLTTLLPLTKGAQAEVIAVTNQQVRVCVYNGLGHFAAAVTIAHKPGGITVSIDQGSKRQLIDYLLLREVDFGKPLPFEAILNVQGGGDV